MCDSKSAIFLLITILFNYVNSKTILSIHCGFSTDTICVPQQARCRHPWLEVVFFWIDSVATIVLNQEKQWGARAPLSSPVAISLCLSTQIQ